MNWTLGAQITPLVVDGIYGAKTTAAIKLFQSQNGLVVDGAFGPKSSAKAMALQANVGGVSYPAGCTSNTGYSSTTGAPCAGGALPAGCASASGYSSTTGIPCGTAVGVTLPAGCVSAAGFSVTTGQPCTATTVVSGSNGYLTDLSADSSNRVSTVYESEQDKVVAGFRATARLSSQTVNRVRVTFINTNTSTSANLGKYISGASLWYGSTKIATMAVAQADRSTTSDLYTFNFSGLNAMIAKDQIGRFYVSVSANGSLDSTDTASANWTVTFTAGGVMATSPDSSTDTYPANDIITTGLHFGKFSANGVKSEINLSASNPAATVVTVQNTAATNNVNLLKFTVKATNTDLTIRKLPVKVMITGTTADDVTNIVNTLKLYRGADLVDSVDGSAGYESTSGSLSTTSVACTDTSSANDDTCTFFFSNLSNPANFVAAGTTAEFTVVADLKQVSGNYSEADTIAASIENADIIRTSAYSVQDTNGDQLTDNNSSIRVGSAVGQVMTLRINGVNTVMGAPSYSNTVDSSGVITSVTYSIPVTVTAFGNTLYMGQSAQLNGTATASNAFALVFQTSAAPTSDETTSSASIALSSTDASIESNGFRLDSGVTKHFIITVNLTTPSSVNSNYRVALKQVRTFTEGLLLTGTSTNLLPVEQFKTDYKLING